MRMVLIRLVIGFTALAPGAAAVAAPPTNPLIPPLFSLDGASPTIGPGITPDDILAVDTPTPMVVVDGAALGLIDPANDDIDAISADIPFPGAQTFALVFSVDRDTIGAAAPDPTLVSLGIPFNATDQAARRQAAGDMFLSTRLFSLTGGVSLRGGVGTNNNTLVLNQFDEGGVSFNVDPEQPADEHNLEPEQDQDNVDASEEATATTATLRSEEANEVYFTLTSGSPSLSDPGFPGSAQPSGARIFYNADPGQAGTEIYANPGQLGLVLADDIDGMIVIDRGTHGTFDAGDYVLFSLAPGSLSGGSAAVFVRTPGMLSVLSTPGQLGLDPADNIDALSLLLCEDAADCATAHGIRRVRGDCDNDGELGPADLACFLECWSGPGTPYDTDGAATIGVSIFTNFFLPPARVIEVNDSIQWNWIAGTHSVVSGRPGSPDGAFSSGGTHAPGHMFQVTFDAAFLAANPRPANVYPFFCVVHGETGAIAVAPHACAMYDANGDADVDVRDFAAFQQRATP